MKWWHGGPKISGGRIDPQSTAGTRSGESDGWVYVTTNRHLATTYASTVEGSAWVYLVDPDCEPEPDPGSMLSYSFRCRGATIKSRFTVSNKERALLAGAVRA